MKKSMATAQIKSTRIAFLVLLALAAMSVELLVSTYVARTRDRVCVCCCWDSLFPGMVYPSRVHLHIYL
jgi:hypothetical protein